MREIAPGLFHWTARHPKIHIEVSSYWLDASGVAFDPLVPVAAGLDQGIDGLRSSPQVKASSTTTAFGIPRALSRRSNDRSARALPAR